MHGVYGMDRSDVIELIPVTYTKDSAGISRPTEGTHRQVMCQVDSVTRQEFFEAGRNGLNPEFVFKVFFGDYEGERIVEYKGNRYGVYRTYQRRNDTVELYVERKGGTN